MPVLVMDMTSVFLEYLVPKLRLKSPIPLLIDKLKEAGEDDEWLREQCETALIKIGGDAAVSSITDMFRSGDWHRRMAACNVLQHVHSDLSVATALARKHPSPLLQGKLETWACGIGTH